MIKKILVHSEPTKVRGGEAHYNMIREKWDVRNLLEVRRASCWSQSFLLSLTTSITLICYLLTINLDLVKGFLKGIFPQRFLSCSSLY